MRHVLTLIAPETAPMLRAQTAFLTYLAAALNPIRTVWLSPFAVDFEIEHKRPAEALALLRPTLDQARIDAVLQPIDNREKRLLISDMDSTIIEQECIDELADVMGIKPQVAAITERAMNGELDFAAALRERVALLKGLDAAQLDYVFRRRITPMPGAKILVDTMRARGAKTILVSGGFRYFTRRVAGALGFQYEAANQLVVQQGKLTGEVKDPILGKDAKRAELFTASKRFRIPLGLTLAVGDGANDLPMLQTAGLGVAYHAKPVVAAATAAHIRHNDLTALLYVQGIPKDQWVVR